MKRLYFIAPNTTSARSISEECQQLGIDEDDIHVVAKNHKAIALAHLHEASIMQTSDFVPAVERGAIAGGAVGLAAGTAVVLFPPGGLLLGGGTALGMMLFGAGFGAWASGMIGISIPNSHLRRFDKAIEMGEVLMLIDVPKDKVDYYTNIIKKHHPEAEIEGMEPNLPPVL